MMRNVRLLLGVFILLGMLACKQTVKNLRPVVTGASGEVLVVINKTLWNDAVGDTLRAIMQEPQLGLPQNEPLFTLLHLGHDGFGRMFKTHRSILDIRIDTKVKQVKMAIKNEYYAKTQAYMRIEAPNNKAMVEFLEKNRAKIVSYFYKGERERKKATIKRNVVQDIFDRIRKKNNFSLAFPSGYRINKDTLNFMWISKETPTSSQGMFIYTYEYTSEKEFTKEAILRKRNFLLKKFIPGPTKGSYMTTEMNYPISCAHFDFKGNYAMETRGLWKVENDFMGGPFQSITFLDKENNKVICFDSYVYYPNQKKREMLRELEAIMYSYEVNPAKSR